MVAATTTLVIVLAGAVYLRGWLKGRSIPVWRACSFFLGLFLTWVPLVPVASADSHMLTAHMIQHLLLMTFAPPLIWLGEPLMTVQLRRRLVPKNLGRPLGHPVFCWLAAAATLIVWHVPVIFQLGMESPTWHFIEHASFLISVARHAAVAVGRSMAAVVDTVVSFPSHPAMRRPFRFARLHRSSRVPHVPDDA